jgi:hypothetical protein
VSHSALASLTDVHGHLSAPEFHQSLNVKLLCAEAVAVLLRHVLPPNWKVLRLRRILCNPPSFYS